MVCLDIIWRLHKMLREGTDRCTYHILRWLLEALLMVLRQKIDDVERCDTLISRAEYEVTDKIPFE